MKQVSEFYFLASELHILCCSGLFSYLSMKDETVAVIAVSSGFDT